MQHNPLHYIIVRKPPERSNDQYRYLDSSSKIPDTPVMFCVISGVSVYIWRDVLMKKASLFPLLNHYGSDHANIVKPLYKHVVSILLVMKS